MNKTGLIFLHGAFGSSGGPDFILSQLKFLTLRGYPVKVVVYGDNPNLLDDVELTRTQCNALIDEGCTHIIVYGVSRGGFVALWTQILYSNLFDGCVVVAGPTNLVTLKTPTTRYTGYFNFKGNKKLSSPVSYGEILSKKPLLLIYGKKDELVPMSQGMELAKVVKSSKYYAVNALHTEVNSHPYAQSAILNWLKGIKEKGLL